MLEKLTMSENLEHFETICTDFMLELNKKLLYVGKCICHVGGKNKKIASLSIFFLVGHNSGLSEDPSYVEYN